jgi:hypothetical protein
MRKGWEALPVTLAVLLAGCGGGGEKTAATATATPPAAARGSASQTIPLDEYLRRADALCKDLRETQRPRLRRMQRRLARDGRFSTRDVMRLNEAGYERSKSLDEKLRTIPEPDAKARLVQDYIDTVRDSLLALGDAVRSYQQGDRKATAEMLARNRQNAIESARIAARIGFRECGTEFSTNAR